jgi:RNA polymerase-binding transcription factor DksA
VPKVEDQAMDDRAEDDQQARERLEAERARVTDLVEDLRDELGAAESAGELSDYDQHPADLPTDTFEREKDLSILEQLEAELAELDAALTRIDAGTYGIDEVTGTPIDPARLDALPTARTNIGPFGIGALGIDPPGIDVPPAPEPGATP